MTIAEETSTGLDQDFVEDWAKRFLDAWNALDGPAVVSLCTNDVRWFDPSTPEMLVGPAEVRDFVEMTGRAFPDLHIVETDSQYVQAGSTRVLAPYRMTGTMLGQMDAFAPTGRKVSVDGVDEWTFRDGLLCSYRTYYDTVDAARQLGVMPAPGTRAERIMVRLQHLQARLQRRMPRPA
jgi:steroid delta-isomerase-like uncharacterized protein